MTLPVWLFVICLIACVLVGFSIGVALWYLFFVKKIKQKQKAITEKQVRNIFRKIGRPVSEKQIRSVMRSLE